MVCSVLGGEHSGMRWRTHTQSVCVLLAEQTWGTMSLKKRLSFKRTWNFNAVSKLPSERPVAEAFSFSQLGFFFILINLGTQLLGTDVWSGRDLWLLLLFARYLSKSLEIFFPLSSDCRRVLTGIVWTRFLREGTSPHKPKKMKEIIFDVKYTL